MSDVTFQYIIAGGVVLAALCFLAQAVTAFAILRTLNRIHEKVAPLADKGEPMLELAESSMKELIPKLLLVAGEAVEISKLARVQVTRVGDLVTDIAEKAKAQVDKIDGAVESTVGSVQHAGESVKDAVLRPVREVNGVVAGIKTAISVYSHGRRQSVDHATQDEEMFI